MLRSLNDRRGLGLRRSRGPRMPFVTQEGLKPIPKGHGKHKVFGKPPARILKTKRPLDVTKALEAEVKVSNDAKAKYWHRLGLGGCQGTVADMVLQAQARLASCQRGRFAKEGGRGCCIRDASRKAEATCGEPAPGKAQRRPCSGCKCPA